MKTPDVEISATTDWLERYIVRWNDPVYGKKVAVRMTLRGAARKAQRIQRRLDVSNALRHAQRERLQPVQPSPMARES